MALYRNSSRAGPPNASYYNSGPQQATPPYGRTPPGPPRQQPAGGPFGGYNPGPPRMPPGADPQL